MMQRRIYDVCIAPSCELDYLGSSPTTASVRLSVGTGHGKLYAAYLGIHLRLLYLLGVDAVTLHS